MNEDRMEGNWKQFKGKVKEQWGKLTDDDLDVISGRRDQLAGKIQERHGVARDEAERAHAYAADYVGIGPVHVTASKSDAGRAIGIGSADAAPSAEDLKKEVEGHGLAVRGRDAVAQLEEAVGEVRDRQQLEAPGALLRRLAHCFGGLAGDFGALVPADPEPVEAVEDVLFDRRPDATERLIQFAETVKGKAGQATGPDR